MSSAGSPEFRRSSSAEKNLEDIENDLETVGENMKQLQRRKDRKGIFNVYFTHKRCINILLNFPQKAYHARPPLTYGRICTHATVQYNFPYKCTCTVCTCTLANNNLCRFRQNKNINIPERFAIWVFHIFY